MTIFRSNKNNELYFIEHLILDIYHLSNNGLAGIYAYPYRHNGESFVYYTKNKLSAEKYVSENFIPISTD